MNTNETNGKNEAAPTDMEGVMRRVQKMLAIANDPRANPAEAAAMAAAAEKVMRKFQISHADALASSMRQSDAFSTADVQASMKRDSGYGNGAEKDYKPKKIPGWAGWIAYAVAKLNDCEIRYVWTVKGVAIRFFGFASDVQVAAWTFDYLVGMTIGGIRSWQRDEREKKTLKETESFRRGFVLAITAMLNRETRAKKEEMALLSSSRALVLVKSASIAERYGDFKYGSSKSTASVLGDAYMQGREAGSKVQLRQGVGTSAAPEARRIK